MAGVNKVILVGNLGIDPEIRTLESGVKVARLRIATSESYTTKDGQKVDQTEWHTVTLWRQLADISERFLSKGKQVYIEGKLRTRSWKDPEGNDRYSTEIVADNMQMLGRVGEAPENTTGSSSTESSNANQSPAAKPAQAKAVSEADEDDLPF